MQENLKGLLGLIPEPPEWEADWTEIEKTELCFLIGQMKETLQNPLWHREGDVWTHTRMVCGELARMNRFRQLPDRQRQELFLAALLHDIGKIPCTRLEDGVWISPNHTSAGARMARELLWSTYGLCGSLEDRTFRETVCSLIRYHSVPMHIMEQENPERRLIRIAANGELSGDFTIDLLCML